LGVKVATERRRYFGISSVARRVLEMEFSDGAIVHGSLEEALNAAYPEGWRGKVLNFKNHVRGLTFERDLKRGWTSTIRASLEQAINRLRLVAQGKSLNGREPTTSLLELYRVIGFGGKTKQELICRVVKQWVVCS